MKAQKQLFHKDFTLVVIGQVISLFGNAILRFALPLFVLQQSGSPALFGLVSASAFIPMVLISPIGGIVADRVNKQRIMVALDFFTAGIIALFMLMMGLFPVVPLVVGTMMLLYGIQGAYAPAVQASMPLLASQEQLVSANAAVNLVNSLSGLLGPVIGGILYGQFGLWPILLVSCACFALSAVLELFIVIPHQKRAEERGVLEVVRSDMAESLSFITRKKPAIGKVLFMVCLLNLVMSSMLVIGMPVIITKYLGLSSQLYGIAQGALAAGGIVGGLCAGLLNNRFKVEKSYLLLVVCAVGIFPAGAMLLLGLSPMASYVAFTAVSALLMVCSTLFSIQMLAFVQKETPTELVGKVISLIYAVSICSQPVGQAMYGVLFERFAAAPGAVVIGSGALSLVVALYTKSAFRDIPVTAEQPAYKKELSS